MYLTVHQYSSLSLLSSFFQLCEMQERDFEQEELPASGWSIHHLPWVLDDVFGLYFIHVSQFKYPFLSFKRPMLHLASTLFRSINNQITLVSC